MPSNITRIRSAIRDKYGNGPERHYSFVEHALNSQPHAQLLDELRRTFTVDDDTDTNDDVSFNYRLEHDRQRWRLALSMVGPFALVIKIGDDESTEVITNPGTGSDAAGIADVATRAGFSLLDGDTIRTPLRDMFSSNDDVEWTVYRALFSDSDRPPG